MNHALPHQSFATAARCRVGLAVAAVCFLSACNQNQTAPLPAGDPARGKLAIDYYGCASCHTIPGIPGADALVGPPLSEIAGRAYLGGVLKNTPANLVQWIEDPPAIDPKTAMPKLNVDAVDATNIASYLYTLKP